MRSIDGFLWDVWVVDKLEWKHGVEVDEVETAFFNPPYKVRRTKDDKYLLYGRTEGGRYLFVVFVWVGRQVKVISARDMTKAERNYYGRK
ncbi:MAG: BrnT family toxin [Caldilineaceae bacterium]